MKHLYFSYLPASVRFIITSITCLFVPIQVYSQGSIVQTNSSQNNFIGAYKMVFEQSDQHYRTTSSGMDKINYPDYGEYSVLWAGSGSNAGSFIYPAAIPTHYNVSYSTYATYNWSTESHLAIHFNRTPKKIAIFRSSCKVDESTISWEAAYFKNLFDSYLFPDIYYFVDETFLSSNILSDSTELLIIPALNAKGNNYEFYGDTILSRCPQLKSRLENFLSKGGTIYTEGNGVFLLEKAGILANGSIDYSSVYMPDNTGIISVNPSSHIISTASAANNGKMFSSALPVINIQGAETLGTLKNDGRAVVFMLKGAAAKNGKILCNTALPTVQGIAKAGENSRQLQWSLNSILYSFSHSIDVTRSVINSLPASVSTGRNSISYDRKDTFDVKLIVRNLSGQALDNISVTENTRSYFKFLSLKSGGVSYTVSGSNVIFGNISLAAHTEKIIEYRMVTPDPSDPVHESVDKFLEKGTLTKASASRISYSEGGCIQSYYRNKNYANVMFSARIFADTDINWKNFLGLDYQPFKVFLIMENKERTNAEDVVYTQYIPKDIPFYWTDNSINIPILKTPGGKFVDVLKGSKDQDSPEYDMDHDGHPDAWLDTASIYPKGYIITEEEVYWANPWNHLRTGNNDFVFEDIDHDGNTAKDTNGDGVADIEEPGDKIRVWKIIWNIGVMNGLQYYDPYCSMEVWVDPPDLLPLSAGVGKAQGELTEDVPGMFYPYKSDIQSSYLSDSTWAHWMDRDENGKVIYKQLIYQKINNYEGFTFIDTLATHYKLLPTDRCAGTVPQPHREFIAVLSLGGEEIDMYHPAPSQSLYSKVNYKTIFNEARVTPVRSTYTYYAPLPNPLQFEYLSDNFTLLDTLNNKIDFLPKKGKAKIVYDIYPSTEYTYYWIRNVGHDVDYNDPSEAIENIESLGDGVFGYMMYDIPKGIGGYRITLPQKEDGSFNTDSIVKVEGKPFTKWLDNLNTANQVEIWEDPFGYRVYIPQLLIPPALDDDNHDGTDDWIDDRGDRFQSSTGYLHDAFMLQNGEDYPNSPASPFQDDIYGMVTSGWDAGADQTYGDDFFEVPGKTHIQICANYEGRGREGNLDIGKGGTVVVEEIFGGSPWVIFSHVLSAQAKGVDITVKSAAVPSMVKFGCDTVFIKHEITDEDEPHTFDANFDPYHVSAGYQEATATVITGGKDPCSLITPDISISSIIDPALDHKTITIYPDQSNSALTGGPKTVSGVFVQLKVEVTNATNDSWVNTTVTPDISRLGTSEIVMSYVAYPRPLVPDDNIGTFTAGWRFNQPENEVLIKTGSSLPEMMPTRRAYFIFLLKVDPSLKKGIYQVPLNLTAEKIKYTGLSNGSVNYSIPAANFCIAEKNANGSIKEFQKFTIGHSFLKNLEVNLNSTYKGLGLAAWSGKEVGAADFNAMKPLDVSSSGDKAIIDLSPLTTLPNSDTTKLTVLQKGTVHLTQAVDSVNITNGSSLEYSYPPFGTFTVKAAPVYVTPVGPMITITNKLYSINGKIVLDTVSFVANEEIIVGTMLKVNNLGSDISQNTVITIYPGPFYKVISDSLPSYCTIDESNIIVSMGSMIPGESKEVLLYYKVTDTDQSDDLITVIRMSDIEYQGTALNGTFKYTDPKEVNLFVYEFRSKTVAWDDAGTEVTVSAEAKNLGLPATNVWFRIYPVIDGGIREFPIAEMRIDSFKTGTFVSLSGNYVIPEGHTVEFVAVIDDDEKIYEILENNNIKTTVYAGPTGIETLPKKAQANVYPNPAEDVITFEYYLPDDMNKVTITITDLKGRVLKKYTDCSSNKGANVVNQNLNGMTSGNYYYSVKAEGKNKHLHYTGKIIKK